MTDLLAQFLDGDAAGAWARARNPLGPPPDVVPADVQALAVETAKRVSRNVDTLVTRLKQIRFRFARTIAYRERGLTDLDEYDLYRGRPAADVVMQLTQFESRLRELSGDRAPLPAILWALAEHVGDVSLLGSADHWHPPTFQFHDRPRDVSAIYADPLDFGVMSGLDTAADYFSDPDYMAELEEDGVPPTLRFAPDRCSKANHSGGTQEIDWPAWSADPVLRDANRHGQPKLTVVEYLRESFRWGGFPGFADYPDTAPKADIEFLAADLEPI